MPVSSRTRIPQVPTLAHGTVLLRPSPWWAKFVPLVDAIANGTLAVIVIQQTELVAAAERGADAFFRGIEKDHNPFTLTMFAARVRGDRAVLLCIQAAAWWVGWDQASSVG